tara:strand:+ start:1008 stop:1223 length:216 start_codon:yes stop_codon:yes gene_type:complete
MKTMMSLDGTKIERVSDEKASRLFEEGYRYVAKSIWKEKVRDVETSEDKKTTKTKSNKMSKAQKRHLKKSN